MFPKALLLPLLLLFLFSPDALAADNTRQIIKELGLEIEKAQDPEEKSSFHIFRARQYIRTQEFDNALEDYNQALELNHQGWIHLERGHFMMARKRYDLAYEDAKAAKTEVPTLSNEADQIIEEAVAEIRKTYEADNPVTIIMDTVVDPTRKTRFDLMREQGVFAKNARRIKEFNAQKAAKRKQKETACATPAAPAKKKRRS